jgi:CO dehydrogenase/acetyl-CoA synthase beta subunit
MTGRKKIESEEKEPWSEEEEEKEEEGGQAANEERATAQFPGHFLPIASTNNGIRKFYLEKTALTNNSLSRL